MSHCAILLALLCLVFTPPADKELTHFDQALTEAEKTLTDGDLDDARGAIERATERDPSSQTAWALKARWAEAAGDRDELVFALHKQYRLAVAQKAPRKEQTALRERIFEVDSIALDLFEIKSLFVKKLLTLAKFYEKEKRPHSAIRIHSEILALDPEHTESAVAVERIASAPDPSLAESARPKDLLTDISEQWIKKFNKKHASWKSRAKLERDHYVTHTNAGYKVMVLSSEAMEQINAFYRVFFRYGTPEDGRRVPRIDLRIFKERDEYLKHGSGPAEWSGGQFTGSAVETFVGDGGVEAMTSVLFHEAAHQFVALATNAVGWLNEGLASYFEGCRILANGTVQVNLPANHRLFPLAKRMEQGWMANADDGIDINDPSGSTPPRAPTFRIVIENEYSWGPPWYAPTWGVVYFLHNYQDPLDGRFVYRAAFREFIDKSGGRSGEGAVKNFEKVVLGHPAKPTRGLRAPRGASLAKLPRTVEKLDAVWREWIINLRNEQMGRLKTKHPYHTWAKHAIKRCDYYDAQEFFEKGIVESPDDVTLLIDFAKLMAGRFKNTDRAAKLALQAIRAIELESVAPEKTADATAKEIKKIEKLLAKWDSRWKSLDRLHDEMSAAARGLAQRYLAEDLTLMAMDVSWRLGSELGLPDMFDYFKDALQRSGKSPWTWELAYNEKNLDGWLASANNVFVPRGAQLLTRFGEPKTNKFDYRFLTLDRVTSGDYSLEAEIFSEGGKNTFCGLVFGKKSDQTFHALILFPSGGGPKDAQGAMRSGYVDLTSFYGSDNFHTWRHNPVDASERGWHKMRIDVTGRLADVWFDEELVVSQEFASREILRGNFGLITGPGQAHLRNVRFLTRNARDRGARIERTLTMKKLRDRGGTRTGSVNDSWIDQVPPWLKDVTWVQNPRESWSDRGAVPTLLLLWTRNQNELIPVHHWLRHLSDKFADVGLECIAVAAHNDGGGMNKYLDGHPFPGSVAVDKIYRKGYGETHELFSVPRFNVPRLLLLDIDQSVVWEGDPGFTIGNVWTPGFEDYVEPVIEELIARRDLRTLFRWRTAWNEKGRDALHRGDFEAALPLLIEARHMDGAVVPEVRDAQRCIESLETAIESIDIVALNLSRNECEPALGVLLDWGKRIGKTPSRSAQKEIKTQLKGKRAKAWIRALSLVKKYGKRQKAGKELLAIDTLLEQLDPLDGPFPKTIRDSLARAAVANDTAAARRALDSAGLMPSRWLAQEYFGF